MVRFPLRATFWDTALIRRRRLLWPRCEMGRRWFEGGTYLTIWCMAVIRGNLVFTAHCRNHSCRKQGFFSHQFTREYAFMLNISIFLFTDIPLRETSSAAYAFKKTVTKLFIYLLIYWFTYHLHLFKFWRKKKMLMSQRSPTFSSFSLIKM